MAATLCELFWGMGNSISQTSMMETFIKKITVSSFISVMYAVTQRLLL